jgi:hypothetical protein
MRCSAKYLAGSGTKVALFAAMKPTTSCVCSGVGSELDRIRSSALTGSTPLTGTVALRRAVSALVAVIGLAVTQTASAISINLVIGGGLTASQQAVFTGATATWNSLLTGYQPGISLTGPTINASGVAIDGAGGILGQAGPTFGTTQGGYFLATTGIMQFDSADLANLELSGTLGAVILHEMAHVLGFGTLWTYNGVYSNGSGQYTGANALAAWNNEFIHAPAAFVPVELGGGAGTANGHWNEVDGGGGLTGIVDSLGRDMRNELMTGWLNSNSFISNTTLQSFVDIGFTVASVSDGAQTVVLFSVSFFFLSIVGKRGNLTRRIKANGR